LEEENITKIRNVPFFLVSKLACYLKTLPLAKIM